MCAHPISGEKDARGLCGGTMRAPLCREGPARRLRRPPREEARPARRLSVGTVARTHARPTLGMGTKTARGPSRTIRHTYPRPGHPADGRQSAGTVNSSEMEDENERQKEDQAGPGAYRSGGAHPSHAGHDASWHAAVHVDALPAPPHVLCAGRGLQEHPLDGDLLCRGRALVRHQLARHRRIHLGLWRHQHGHEQHRAHHHRHLPHPHGSREPL